jgi:phospholipid/cholesterol/gamma-HCH transport system permease protein
MAEDTTVQEATGDKALKPDKKGVLTSFFDFFGGPALRLNNSLGALAIFFFRSFFMIFRVKAIPEIVQQIYFIGAKSAQIVMLVGFFTGMVLGLQLYFVLVKFGSVGVLGTAIALTLIRELGPVMTAIMITARAGSAMTAEIGIQRISEQIDALSTMRIDPLGYLISPRIAAAVISFPILTTFFNMIGIIGAWVSGCLLLGVNSGTYFYRVVASTVLDDLLGCYYKSIVFGLLVVTICCFQGFFTHMRTDSYGAKSVSLSTTSAVVFSCVMILISDYVVTSFIV